MKIKYWMTKNPVTISSKDFVNVASSLMKEKNIHRLPVIDHQKLVGIITYRNILEAQPSPATSLSVHEINYLNAQLLVKDVMKKDPITVSPEDLATKVMLLGREKGIGSFPVLDNNKLVGIITANDMFELFLEALGAYNKSALIMFKSQSKLAEISPAFNKEKIDIDTYLTLTNKNEQSFRSIIRIAKKNQEKSLEILKALNCKIEF